MKITKTTVGQYNEKVKFYLCDPLGVWTHPSSSSTSISRFAKKAIRGKCRSWCSMNTRTGSKFGTHMWLMKRAILP